MGKALRDSLALAVFSFAAFASMSASAQTPQDYAMWCQGATGLAVSSGQTIKGYFLTGPGPADQNLRPGHCSWLDRALRSGEPHQIIYRLPTTEDARDKARAINSGAIWTFWVYNAGRFMTATAVAEGALTQKP
jgi:hypothetical protein